MNHTPNPAPAPDSQHPSGFGGGSGRDELNLVDFPIGVLQYQQPAGPDGRPPSELVCTVESYDTHLKRVVPRTLTRRTASRHGFPTPLEDEVLIALLTLTKLKTDFASPRVEFRAGELYELMRWPHNGGSNRRLAVALDRLQGLSLKYENSWTADGVRYEKEFTTGLLDSYSLVTGGQSGRDQTSWAVWAAEVFADIRSGNVKELDTDRYFALDRPVARRLYRFLDRHLAQKSRLKIDLHALAAHLGVSGTRHVGKIKERLRPGVEALERDGGLIRPREYADRFAKRGRGKWTAVFERADETTENKRASRSAKPPRRETTAARGLVAAFYGRWSGDARHLVTRHEVSQAEDVISRYGEERAAELLPRVIRLMRQAFPQARAFGATMNYWHDAEKSVRRATPKAVARPDTTAENDAEREARRTKMDALRKQWDAMGERQRQAVRDRVCESCSDTVRRFIAERRYDDRLVELACLDELKRTAA